MADRRAQTLAVGASMPTFEALLRCQPNAPASLAEGLDHDLTATGRRLDVQAWLDARLGEIEGRSGRSSGPERPA